MSSIDAFVKSQQDLLASGVENLALHDDDDGNSHFQSNTSQPPSTKYKKKRGLHAFHDLSSQSYIPQQEHSIDPNAASFNIGLFPPPATHEATTIGSLQTLPSQPGSAQMYDNASNMGYLASTTDANLMSQFQQGSQINPNSRGEVFTDPSNMTHSPDTYNINQPTVSEDLSLSGLRNQMNEFYKENTFMSFHDVHPPLAGTQYKAVDESNAIPQFARTTMYSIPFSEDLREKSKIPLGLILRPFADCTSSEAPPMDVPQIKINEGETVPRCGRCRAYLNPAMQHHGSSMTCNICGFKSPVPIEYASTMSAHGVRDDYNTRPELHTGVVDYIVPKEYNLSDDDKPISKLHRIFLIDLSFNSYKSKLVETACSAIRMSLYKDDGSSNLPEGTKISIVGFDDRLHFFNLSSDLMKPDISIISDLEDPFIPFLEGLFVDPVESSQIIETTLLKIEQKEISAAASESTFGPLMKVCNDMLKDYGGGQVIAILSTLPSFGPGTLVLKTNKHKQHSEFIKDILTPDNKFYEDITNEFVKNNIGLNLLVATNSNVDLINLGFVAYNTGGSVKEWLPFNVDRDEITFSYELKRIVQDISGYQGQLKVRCSRGLQVSKYYGPFKTVSGDSAPLLPIISGDTSVVCDISYDSKLDISKDAHFQAALLYTSADGIRKVRVVNSILSITQRIQQVFDFSDQDSIVKLLLKRAIEKAKTTNMIVLRNLLKMQCSEIMAAYKHFIGKNNSLPTQLVLPQSLRTLPMMILSILKTPAFKEKTVIPDKRVESMFNLSHFCLPKLSTYLYPQLYCIHALEDGDFTVNEETGLINLGKTMPMNMTNLEFGGAYLVYNGDRIIIWLHSDVNKLLLKDLFGHEVESINQLSTTPFISQLPKLDTYISFQVNNIITYLSRHFSGIEKQSVELCRFRIDANEPEFQSMFVEDQSSDLTPSYSDFLKEIHHHITTKANDLTSPAVENDSHHDSDNISRRFGVF